MTPSGNAGWRVRNSVLQRLWNDTKFCSACDYAANIEKAEATPEKAEVEELEQEISSQKDIIAD